MQRFTDVEFIVSDNAGTDDTEAVVRAFDDSRIRLINTGRRVSMRENWEFALGHVTGQFVLYIGDDDALVAGALEDLANLVKESDARAVKWQPPIYLWPSIDDPSAAGSLSVSASRGMILMKSAAALRAVTWGLLQCRHTPSVYHGLVSMEVVRHIMAKTGEFFRSEIPDYYSGLAVANTLASYLYVDKPYTIAGISRHSTGTSAVRAASDGTLSPAAMFASENKLGPHPQFLETAAIASVHGYVTDTLLRIRDTLGAKTLIPMWYRLLLTVQEISARPNENLESPSHPLYIYSKSNRRLWLYLLYVRLFRGRAYPEGAKGYWSRRMERSTALVVDTRKFGIDNACDASILFHDLTASINPAKSDRCGSILSVLRARLLAAALSRSAARLFVLSASL